MLCQPSGPPAWKTIPSWAVIGTGDQVIPPAELTFMAQRAGARITEVNAGHLSLITEAPVVTRDILQAVQAPDDSPSRPGVPRTWCRVAGPRPAHAALKRRRGALP